MKRILLVSMCLLFMHLLVACGGTSGSNNSTAELAVAKGVFVNGPVVGLGYNSGGKSGITGKNGEFEYEQGNKVRFYLGDIVIGETTGGASITLLHLVLGADAENAKVINISRFLLSVGLLDPETKIITIQESVFNAAKGKTLDFDNITETDLQQMVRALKNDPNALLVSIQEAINEVSASILRIYGGTYQGIFNGPASSTKWELYINPDNGIVSGKGLDGLQESIYGSITKGIILNAKAYGGCSMTGSINVSTGQLTGNWLFNYDQSKNGTFTGRKI
ncbi:MAG TPA: hypothetical protein VGL27_03170 [Negativicutes bacterium]